MRRRELAIGVCILAAAAAWPTVGAAQQRAAPTWAVDPGRPGQDPPPAGRSLFDFVVTTQVDGKLVYTGPGGNKVEAKARNENGNKFVEVTIDGRVVYRAGQAGAPDSPKKGDVR